MRKKWNMVLSTAILIVACLCMTACQSSSDDEQKDTINNEQNVENDNNEADTDNTGNDAYEMPDADYLEDDEIGLEEELEEDPLEDEEIIVPEDNWTEDTIQEDNWE